MEAYLLDSFYGWLFWNSVAIFDGRCWRRIPKKETAARRGDTYNTAGHHTGNARERASEWAKVRTIAAAPPNDQLTADSDTVDAGDTMTLSHGTTAPGWLISSWVSVQMNKEQVPCHIHVPHRQKIHLNSMNRIHSTRFLLRQSPSCCIWYPRMHSGIRSPILRHEFDPILKPRGVSTYEF